MTSRRQRYAASTRRSVRAALSSRQEIRRQFTQALGSIRKGRLELEYLANAVDSGDDDLDDDVELEMTELAGVVEKLERRITQMGKQLKIS